MALISTKSSMTCFPNNVDLQQFLKIKKIEKLIYFTVFYIIVPRNSKFSRSSEIFCRFYNKNKIVHIPENC